MFNNLHYKGIAIGLAIMVATTAYAGVKALEISSVTPAQNTTIEASGTLTITWNQAVKVTAENAVVFTNGSTQLYGVTKIDPADNTKTVTTYSDLPAGTYTVSNNYADGAIVPKDAIESEYDVNKAIFTLNGYKVAGLEATALTVAPANTPFPSGDYESLYSFKADFTYAGSNTLAVNSELAEGAYLMKYVKLAGDQTTVDIASVKINKVEGQENAYQVTFNLSDEVKTAGNYNLILPEGFIYAADFLSAAVSLNLSIAEQEVPDPTEVKVTVDPKEGIVSTLNKLTLTFDEWTIVGSGAGKATLKVDDKEAIYLPDAEIDFSLPENVICQSLVTDGKDIDEPGKYVVTFPKGYFLLGDDGIACPEFTLTYEIKGVGVSSVIVSAEGLYNVYSVAGVKVLSTCNISDLNNLPSSLYIINGKKYIIRK